MAKLEDLELQVDTPSRMVILSPRDSLPMKDKEGKEAYVDVYSSDSEVARKFRTEIKTSRLRLRNPNALNGEKLESEDIELLAALTSGWYLVNFEGEPIDLDCTRDNARKVYAKGSMAWLKDQVDQHAGNRANFSRASSQT